MKNTIQSRNGVGGSSGRKLVGVGDRHPPPPRTFPQEDLFFSSSQAFDNPGQLD
jgi:hypothetical protein